MPPQALPAEDAPAAVRPVRQRRNQGLWVAWAFAMLAGCHSGRELPVPAFSPEEAGRQALAEYDVNKDGFLDAKELERCPALQNRLKALDLGNDGRLSAAEIAARIAHYQESGVGLTRVSCQVFLDKRPLVGATVTLAPEKFLGGAIRPASGVTDNTGLAELRTEGEDVPGVQCGFYHVQISRKNAKGEEAIPARYNVQTTLGVEVVPEKIRIQGEREELTFQLKSK
jgi:hypothetical protein